MAPDLRCITPLRCVLHRVRGKSGQQLHPTRRRHASTLDPHRARGDALHLGRVVADIGHRVCYD